MVEIQGKTINVNHVERVEVWGQRTLMNGSVTSKGCIIYFASGRKWKCGWPLTQVLAIMGSVDW